MSLLLRALLVWLVMLIVASLNGAFREALLVPRLGDPIGRAISTVMLSALVLLLAWFTIQWIAPPSTRDAWMIGALWVALTLTFEFVGGHYLFGKPWAELTADYDVLRGRIWIVVLITTAVAPRLASAMRGWE